MKRLPVYILSGFLGSGKTTVLLEIIKYCKENKIKPAILLNEIGKVNLDQHLFNETPIVELLEGCICCSIKDEFVKALSDIKENVNNPYDLVIVEGTGVATPIELLSVFGSPIFASNFEVYSVISLINAQSYLEDVSFFSFNSVVKQILLEQVKFANYIIINKIDLISANKLEKVIESIDKLKLPSTPIQTTIYGNISMEELLTKRHSQFSINVEELNELDEGNRYLGSHSKQKGIHSLLINDFPILSSRELKKWIQQLPKGIVRAKGYVSLRGEKHFYSIQLASKILSISKLPYKSETMKPRVLFIGNDIDLEIVKAKFK
ncbi:CobW family GTP-binding protein [Gottfriedia acidiceleris]|uniref:CobW family GTP-binding protein n=1 Tax=Gottfriedia acidiceleris TaxID=371036 RepID=UPI000B44FEA0|nr:GTP-binding protein [Gottfriedia acidiceleris]